MEKTTLRTAWTGLFILMFIVISANPAGFAFGSELDSKMPILSLEIKNETMQNVLARLSETSGYKIIYEGDFEDLRVSIKIKDVTFEEALNRCLNKYNHAIIWDNNEKIVTVYIYGVISYPVKFRPGLRKRQLEPGKTEDKNYDYTPDRSRATESYQDPSPTISGRDTRFIQTTRTTSD